MRPPVRSFVGLVSSWTRLWPLNNFVIGLHLHKSFPGGATLEKWRNVLGRMTNLTALVSILSSMNSALSS